MSKSPLFEKAAKFRDSLQNTATLLPPPGWTGGLIHELSLTQRQVPSFIRIQKVVLLWVFPLRGIIMIYNR